MSGINKLMNKSFLERAISGILLVIIALVTIISGGDILFATIFIISMIGMFEFYRVCDMQKTPMAVIGYLSP